MMEKHFGILKICFVAVLLQALTYHKLSCTGAPMTWNDTSANNLQSRLSVAESDSYSERNVQGPDTYVFGYDFEDPETNNVHFRHEERLPNGTIVGNYGYVTPEGNTYLVKYSADHRGYRATVEMSKRAADVKPIPVNVEQELADEISSVLQNEEVKNKRKNVITSQSTPTAGQEIKFVINEGIYQIRQNTPMRAHQYPVKGLPVAAIQQPRIV